VADGSFSNRLYANFNRAHIFSKEACRVCWARYYCSGGCHANALHVNGDIMVPHEIGCILERKRIECAIGLLARRAL
ncbi:MAG: SPASM domain-containing protein, partial [Clostridiales Family XIII bacterium]|nr:SPASM domain-containing protein [Clostridiales Family XIII bacterium]